VQGPAGAVAPGFAAAPPFRLEASCLGQQTTRIRLQPGAEAGAGKRGASARDVLLADGMRGARSLQPSVDVFARGPIDVPGFTRAWPDIGEYPT
jgi:hypothetical protein